MKNELQKDDESLREIGMTDGPRRIGNITLRPMTVLGLSQLQRNGVFDDGFGDSMQKSSAFAFVLSAPKDKVRSVANDKEAFLDAVDSWMEANVNHHSELEPISRCMNEILETYLAAGTKAKNSSGDEVTSKNL